MIKVFVLSFALLISFMHTDTINAESESNSSILVEEYVYDENGMLVNYEQSEIPLFETKAATTSQTVSYMSKNPKGTGIVKSQFEVLIDKHKENGKDVIIKTFNNNDNMKLVDSNDCLFDYVGYDMDGDVARSENGVSISTFKITFTGKVLYETTPINIQTFNLKEYTVRHVYTVYAHKR